MDIFSKSVKRLETKIVRGVVRVSQVLVLVTAFALAHHSARSEEGQLRLWRLDCGMMFIQDISYFSDAFVYEGQSAELSNGCYLVQNGDQYLLWDSGIPLEYLGNTQMEEGWLETVETSVEDQLRELSLSPNDIDYIGISHFHGDHVGQAEAFKNAVLLIGQRDYDYLQSRPPGNAKRRLAPWFEGDRDLKQVRGDDDVFGDGTVIILSLPGHTPGHQGLLVNLPKTGPVLLAGDLYHFHNEIGHRIVSKWNSSRADTMASMERIERIVEAIDPIVIVQHDPKDDSLLPKFPQAAE